mgnify:CR=1 FL=1|tara:strand:- start:6104 stop:6886 length:783 start_codon:yes stop_codon:yes gene_type:complete
METLLNKYNQLLDHIFSTPPEILLGQLVVAWVIYFCLKSLYYLLSVRLTGRHRKPISFDRGPEKRILLVGDSTAVGTGSNDEGKTLAAFLAKDYPDTSIINRSQNGALTKRVLELLEGEVDNHYDMIMISTGGNDVWGLTRMKSLRLDFSRMIKLASLMSNGKVAVLFFGNEGSAPFFPWLLKGFLLRRTHKIRDLFAEVCHEEEVEFFELFSSPSNNPFVKDPKNNFAPDGLHPNENGYWNWYKHIWRLIADKGFNKLK